MDCRDIRQQLFDDPSEETLYIAELEESVFALETMIWEFLDTLPDADKALIEGYLHALAELELHTVVKAYNTGFKNGKRIGRNGDLPLYRE